MKLWGGGNPFPHQPGVDCLRITSRRCLRFGSRVQTSDFCFRTLTNPSPKTVQLLPSWANKQTTLLTSGGRMSLSFTEDGIRPLKLSTSPSLSLYFCLSLLQAFSSFLPSFLISPTKSSLPQASSLPSAACSLPISSPHNAQFSPNIVLLAQSQYCVLCWLGEQDKQSSLTHNT